MTAGLTVTRPGISDWSLSCDRETLTNLFECIYCRQLFYYVLIFFSESPWYLSQSLLLLIWFSVVFQVLWVESV